MENTEEQKFNESEELKGTNIGGAAPNEKYIDIDVLISETLSESKEFETNESIIEKENNTLAATPITKSVISDIDTANLKTQHEESNVTKEKTQSFEEKRSSETEKDQYNNTFIDLKTGDIIKGTIEKVDSTGALVNIKYKSDGFLDASELTGKNLKVGDTVDVFIEKLSTKDGNVILSLKKAEYELRKYFGDTYWYYFMFIGRSTLQSEDHVEYHK